MTRLIRILKLILVEICFLLILLPSFASNSRINADKANKTEFSIQHLSQSEIAHLLNWLPSTDSCDECGGSYHESLSLTEHPNPLPISKLPTQITAEGPTLFRSDGLSILQDDVVLTQPGRIVQADKAFILRDGKTKKIVQIRFEGNVHLLEHGKHDVADSAVLDLDTNIINLYNNVYHISEPTIAELKFNKQLKYDAWGKAQRFFRDANNKLILLWNATYTTCSPLNPIWQLFGSHIILDKESGRGKAYNAVIRLKKIPIFYMPYLSFPIDSRRKTGFLAPTPSYSRINGFGMALPFYWNIAPNDDMTITPNYMSNRGVLLQDEFRYLTHIGEGYIDTAFIPDDRGFNHFRNNIIDTTIVTPVTKPYLDNLENDSNNRAAISIHNDSQWGPKWSSRLDINYATDPYYFNDFSSSPYSGSINQLFNMANLQYNGTHWQWIGLIQAYQTLHLITQITTPVSNQFTRLPEMDVNGEYPDLPLGLDLHMNGQGVNFLYDSDFVPYTYQNPVGQRLHWMTSLSRAFYRDAGYLIPQISIDTTQYFANLATFLPNQNRPYFDGNRSIPLFNIDSGLYFDRSFEWNDSSFTQTLEPRFFYLYVPYQNQNQFPIFDTVLLPFSFDQLFSSNRFTGYDRIENANQISLALTSRILDGDSGDPLLRADLGIIYYFEQPKVPLFNPANPLNPVLPDIGNWSPAVAQLSFDPWTHWELKGNLAWDTSRNQINNTQVGFTYNRDSNHIFTFNYDFVPKFEHTSLNTLGLGNTNLISAGLSWPITHNWSALGYSFYNINQSRPESYYGGLEYSTCCWALRFIVDKRYIGTLPPATGNPHLRNQFRTTFFVQIMLKGLTDIGNNDPSSLLQSTLPGYQDPFKM